MSRKKPMTPEDYYKRQQEMLEEEFDENHLSFTLSIPNVVNSELSLFLTTSMDIYDLFQGDTLYEGGSTFLDLAGANADYFINSSLKQKSGDKAFQTTKQYIIKKASSQKKSAKIKAKKLAIKQAKLSRESAKAKFKKIPIYSIAKLLGGIAKQVGTEYNIDDHLVEYDGVAGSGAFENAMSVIRLNEKKEHDFTINVGSNAMAVVADYHSKGYAGNFVRAGMNEIELLGLKKVLENDKKFLVKDTEYTLDRVSGSGYDYSKKAMAKKVALKKAVEPLEKLRDELNLSKADFLNISTKIAQNTTFNDNDKQKERISYLKMLIKAYPNKAPDELMEIVLDSEDEIEKKYKYQKIKIDDTSQPLSLGNNFGETSLIKIKKGESKTVIAQAILKEKVQKKIDHENFITGEDLRAEKKYLRRLEQQKIGKGISYDALLEEKHKIKNAEMKQKRVIASQEFEWMYQEIIRRLLKDLKISQFKQ